MFTVDNDQELAKMADLQILNKRPRPECEFVTSKIYRTDQIAQEIEENPKMSQTEVYTSNE